MTWHNLLQFKYCENATRFEKISPFFKITYVVCNAKTKLEIYSNFRGLLRLSKLQLLTPKLTELLSLGMASLSRHIWQIFCSSFVAIDCCCIEQLSPHKHFQTPNLFLILCNIKSYFSIRECPVQCFYLANTLWTRFAT